MISTEGTFAVRGYSIWYRIVGETDLPGKFPLLCVHGGPGAPHDYLEPLEAMASGGRRVIFGFGTLKLTTLEANDSRKLTT